MLSVLFSNIIVFLDSFALRFINALVNKRRIFLVLFVLFVGLFMFCFLLNGTVAWDGVYLVVRRCWGFFLQYLVPTALKVYFWESYGIFIFKLFIVVFIFAVWVRFIDFCFTNPFIIYLYNENKIAFMLGCLLRPCFFSVILIIFLLPFCSTPESWALFGDHMIASLLSESTKNSLWQELKNALNGIHPEPIVSAIPDGHTTIITAHDIERAKIAERFKATQTGQRLLKHTIHQLPYPEGIDKQQCFGPSPFYEIWDSFYSCVNGSAAAAEREEYLKVVNDVNQLNPKWTNYFRSYVLTQPVGAARQKLALDALARIDMLQDLIRGLYMEQYDRAIRFPHVDWDAHLDVNDFLIERSDFLRREYFGLVKNLANPITTAPSSLDAVDHGTPFAYIEMHGRYTKLVSPAASKYGELFGHHTQVESEIF